VDRRLASQPGDLVLVTGATGRIGANLCQSLLADGFRVRAITLPGDPARSKLAGLENLDLEIVEADLRDRPTIRDASADVDAICHLAAVMDVGELAPADFWSVNVDATHSLLEAARPNHRLSAFVFASTDATYPASRPRFLPIPESHPQDPVNAYGLSKVVGERMCLGYRTEWDVPVRILRFGNVGTPDERASGASFRLAAHIERFRAAKRNHDNYLWIKLLDLERPWADLEASDAGADSLIALVGPDGRPWQSHYTDVRDAVAGVLLALRTAAADGEAFNIVGPAPTTWLEAVRYIAERRGLEWRTALVPIRQATELSTAKARGIMGYVPRITFEQAVDDGLAMERGADVGVIGMAPGT
jgi:nucleoside-diphosphate-sugar epimerase